MRPAASVGRGKQNRRAYCRLVRRGKLTEGKPSSKSATQKAVRKRGGELTRGGEKKFKHKRKNTHKQIWVQVPQAKNEGMC